MIIRFISLCRSPLFTGFTQWCGAAASALIMFGFCSACRTDDGGEGGAASKINATLVASSSTWKGTIRLVNPNDWACVAWTNVSLDGENRVVDNILKKNAKIFRGSRLISIKSSKFFQDYSQDGTSKGLNLNGLWGDCPKFTVVASQTNPQEVVIQSDTHYTAWAADGNGSRMVANKAAAMGCATARDGQVVIENCNSQDSNQRWLWDRGSNGGYGYIKAVNNNSQCLDVSGGGAGVSWGHTLILHRCKPFIAGPGGMSNNQRFWLDESGD